MNLADLKEFDIIMYLYLHKIEILLILTICILSVIRYTSYNRVDIVLYIDNLLYNKLYRYSAISIQWIWFPNCNEVKMYEYSLNMYNSSILRTNTII